MRLKRLIPAIACGILLPGCHRQQKDADQEPPEIRQCRPKGTCRPPSVYPDRPARFPGLESVVAFAAGVLSGSQPDKDSGFETLRTMGFKTVVSVDGAKPDIEQADKHRMQYIHMPVGYGRTSPTRSLQLAKAVAIAREQAPHAPLYIHCHHGKHHSASAAAAVAVTLGLLPDFEALARMRVAGTSGEYTGLFECVQQARRADPDQLAAVEANFTSAWKTTGLVKTMVKSTTRSIG